jgi:hypothetical protein
MSDYELVILIGVVIIGLGICCVALTETKGPFS